MTANRNVRNGRMVALSSNAEPCRMIAWCSVRANGRDLRSDVILLVS
jgi:hypothetical protein